MLDVAAAVALSNTFGVAPLNEPEEWKKAEAYAEEKGETDLLDRRLADDMHPLSTQIGFTCLQVEQLLARLTGGPSPDLSPVATFGEAQALIARTIAMIDAADAILWA